MQQDYYQPLLAGHTYHIYSRAVGNEKLFLSEENYFYFLQKLKHHVSPIAEIYCYSLLPNHFHILTRIRSEEDIILYFKEIKKINFNSTIHSLSDFIMERFSNFLNGYTKAFNKKYNRKGALFMDYLRRSKVKVDSTFTAVIMYIHRNAVHHGLTKKIGEWKYDSYYSIISEGATLLLKTEVLYWFGGKQEYIQFHNQPISLKVIMTDV